MSISANSEDGARRAALIDQAASALKRGEAVVFPTDTVYGLGVAVNAASGPDVLYDLKERDRGKPIAWLVSGCDDLDRFGSDVPACAYELARAFWPGPLTLIIHASENVPEAYRSRAGTIGLRMPNNQTALELVRLAGSPLATTSANLSGREASRSFDAIDPALLQRVETVVPDDTDDDKSGVASTVIDCTSGALQVVRQGAVSFDEVRFADLSTTRV